MKKTLFLIIISSAVLFSACAPSSQTDGAGQTQEPGSGNPDNDNNEAAASALVTEEDYRGAIASASDDEKKLELYTEFSSVYRMSADEYKEYAALCEKAGDTVSQRRALFALYRIDPTEEHGRMMSDMTLKITAKDDDKAEGLLAALAAERKNCEADGFSPEAVKKLIASDDWKKSFFIDNGTFTSHTEFSGEGISALTDADSIESRVVITEGDSRYLCIVSYDGVRVGRAGVKDGKTEGDYYFRQMDAENVDIVSAKGYIKDGHYVNQLEVKAGDTVYSGSFDDAGHTKEKQPEGFEGVVYAYAADGGNYLYVEGADAATFVANVGEMGFEDF